MARRSESIQRLIDDADQSISLLASLDGLAAPPPESAPTSNVSTPGFTRRPPLSTGFGNSSASLAMSSDSFDFHSSVASSAPPSGNGYATAANYGYDDDNDDDEAMQLLDQALVVDRSMRGAGLVHVKGVFPDHSVEFVDLDPRFATIGEMKRAFCTKRETRKDLGFDAKDARIMFADQLVEDDALVLDCGMNFDGTIHIVRALSGGFLSGGARNSGDLGSRLNSSARSADPKLPISSIASAYANHQYGFQQQQQQQFENGYDVSRGFRSSLALVNATTTQMPTFKAETLSRHVRPEEANFAEIASDFYEHLASVRNTDLYCEKLLGGYIDVLQTRLENLEAQARGSALAKQRFQDEIKELGDERNTWRLLYELRQICHTGDDDDVNSGEGDDTPMAGAESDELHFDMLEDDAVRLLETRNENFKIQRAVKAWLENIALEKTVAISERRGTSGSRTLKLMRKGVLHSDQLVHLDPDAVLREGDEFVLEDDAEDEAELMKSVWLFVRAGKISDAVDLCIRLGQSWRAASLSGGAPLGASESNERKDDVALERWGNPYRALWKSTCWKFSEQSNQQLSLSKGSSMLARQYEEIIYGALSGNVEAIAKSPLTETWEDHIWAYLQAMTEQQQDEILHKLLKVKLQSSQLVVGSNPHYLRHYVTLLEKTKYLKRYQANLDTLFEELKGSRVESVRVQANEPHRHIQAKLVTAKVEYIVSNILDVLLFNSNDDSYNWDLLLDAKLQTDEVSPLFLRFAAHFTLFSAFTGEKFDEQAGHMILKMYIRHLVKHRQLQLVPVYVSRLPYAGAVEIYVQVLATVEDSLERELIVKCILQYSSMEILSTVLQIAVDRMCEEYRQIAQDQKQSQTLGVGTNGVTTSAIDLKRMRTIEYLCFYNEHRAEALYYANVLAHQFVHEGKFGSLTELFAEHVPEDSIGVIDLHRASQTKDAREMDLAIRELLSWKAYIFACGQYDAWRHCISGSSAWSLYSEEKEFVTELMYHVSRATTGLMEALHFENGWMAHCSSSSEEDEAAIRQLCLPLLVFNLHYVQLESARILMRLRFYSETTKVELARPLLEKSLQVADVVADEHHGVYKALSQTECRDLLHGFRESAVALLYMGDDGDKGLDQEGAVSKEVAQS
ncbi:Nuclear pore complex protein [Globisporangium polare]